MRVRLFKGDGSLVLEGEALFPPIVGQPFRVVHDNSTRVTTTDVASMSGDGVFRTIAGAEYRVELIGPEALQIVRRFERA